MKGLGITIALTVTSASLLFTGCGKKVSDEAEHNHSEHEEGEGSAEISYKEGQGLTINPEVLKALGIKTAEAEERLLENSVRVMAHVFALSPQVLASATVSVAEAARLEDHSSKDAKLVRIDRSTASTTRQVELVVALDRNPKPVLGEFVDVTFNLKASKVLSVPVSALLESASGTFVYVMKGQSYLRTPVKAGTRTSEYVEIVDGLHLGDVVVTAPVEQLWLSELRLTKGGGHSH